jgi:Cu/Ag efflux protein CusF
MKKFALLLSVLFAAGVAFAQDKPATTETKPATAPKTTSHHHSTKAKAVAGEVVSVDAEKNTITFKNDKGENLTWPAEGKATASLKTVTAGEKVTIAYSVDAQGAPKAATEIKPASVKAPAPKAPEKK